MSQLGSKCKITEPTSTGGTDYPVTYYFPKEFTLRFWGL